MAKNPLDLYDEINSPFDTKIISRNKDETPETRFNNHRLTRMSPNDYYKFVASQINTTPEKLMAHRQNKPNEMSVDDMRAKMRSGTKFDTPWLVLTDYGSKGSIPIYFQEGLHRMLAAGQEYGMDAKQPVYIGYDTDKWNQLDTMPMDDFIKHYNEVRQSRYDDLKAKEELNQREIDKMNRELTAEWLNIPINQVTPEQIKKYLKYEDELFREEF